MVDQGAELERTELTVADRGVRIVGLPIVPDQYRKDFATEAAVRESNKAAENEDVQTRFQIIHLSASLRLGFLRRTLPQTIATRAAEDSSPS